jgi:hypothetical protein
VVIQTFTVGDEGLPMTPARACAAGTLATPATMASEAAVTAPNASERLIRVSAFIP